MAYKIVDAEQLDAGLTAVAEALREKSGSTELLSFPDGMAAEADAVYEAGKKAEYDAFWNAFQDNGSKANYDQVFAYDHWNDATYNPKYALVCDHTNGLRQTFSGATMLTDVKVPVIVKSGRLVYTFSNCVMLRNIPLIKLETEITELTSAFNQCGKLENLSIEGPIGGSVDLHWSPLFKSSIESIVNALSGSASGKSATFSLNAVNAAFETAEGAADGSASAEWLALAGAKANWTISLV